MSLANYGIGSALLDLVDDQSSWSQKTFGPDEIRGPIEALRHLAKEAQEAIATPGNIEEYADCFLLILDASRRAGFSLSQLINAAEEKMSVNKKRTWPKPIDDTPVEHVRE